MELYVIDQVTFKQMPNLVVEKALLIPGSSILIGDPSAPVLRKPCETPTSRLSFRHLLPAKKLDARKIWSNLKSNRST
jgi:hypothetical protein